jgi:hypothetical protein
MKRNTTRKGQPNQRNLFKPSRFELFSKHLGEDDDFREEPEFLEARAEIERFVEAIQICTYGSLAKRYPEWAHMLTSILESSDKIAYNDSDPAPSKVRFEVKEVKPLDYGFNNQPRDKYEEMMGRRAA